MKILELRVVVLFLITSFISNINAYELPEEFDNFSSVDDAIVQIQESLKNQGYSISLVVNHSAAAASVGLELRPTQVILARQPRRIEKKSRHRSRTLAIDLPVKVLVYEDDLGDINIRHNPIGYLIDRHNAKVFDRLWLKTRKTNKQFTDLDTGLISVPSSLSIDDTVSALQSAISSNPAFRIPLTLNFCNRGGRSCPQLIVFGNPNAGTPLMQVNQEIGMDLPQKFLVWKDVNGQVNITYNDPFFFAKRHNIQGQEGRLQAISNALANFAKLGTGNVN